MTKEGTVTASEVLLNVIFLLKNFLGQILKIAIEFLMFNDWLFSSSYTENSVSSVCCYYSSIMWI